MPTSFEVIFLGTLPLIDTTQGDEVVENAAGILGTYGSAAAPLSTNIRFLTAERLSEDDNDSYDIDNGGGFDSFRINGGTAQNFDAVAIYNAVITYADGTTATITATVFQDVFGNTYLAPEEVNNADQIALTAAPIQSLTLQSVASNTGDMIADRVAGDFKSAVDGTAAGDNMTLGYTDAQGDQITTGNDYILSGAGNDTINAADGNDTIQSGDGSDLIEDWNGNDSVRAGEGNDTVNLGAGNDTIQMEGGDDLVRVWDNAGLNNLSGGSGTDTLDFANWQSSSGVTVDVNAGGAGSFSHFSGATNGSFTGFEAISGTANADRLDAGDADVALRLSGEEGNDRIIGGAANDTIDGGAGADSAAGGAGNDSILGGDGNDILSGDFVTPTLVNGDFSGGLTGWTGTDMEVNPETNYIAGGNSSNTVAEMDGNAGQTTVMQQSFSVASPGIGRLEIDAALRNVGSSGAAGSDGFTIEILNAQGLVIASTIILPTSFTMTTYALEVAFPASGTYTLRLTEVGNNDSFGTVIDNVRFEAATGDDTIDGGAGNDLIDGGAGNDNLIGGEGLDTVYGGAGNDVVAGGGGADIVFADDGNDTVDGGGDNDTLEGGAGDDRLFGEAGNDVLSGGSGADSLSGGDGDDLITGGDGRDTLVGGSGADMLTGGVGPDVFVVDAGGDIITDFDALTGIQGGGAPDQTENDFVDLSAFYNETTLAAWNAANPENTYRRPIDWLRADQADGSLAQAGGLQLRGTDGQPLDGSLLNQENTGVICFAAGTLIATPAGDIPVEDLCRGDLVLTLDHGAQPLVWTGATARTWSAAPHPDKPIRIKAGSLGPGIPGRDLKLSPQHRILMTGPDDPVGVLVPAKSLLGRPGVRQMSGCRSVVYHHIMLARHQVLMSDGTLTESFYPGATALKMMHPGLRASALRVLQLVTDGKGLDHYPMARKALSVQDARQTAGNLTAQAAAPGDRQRPFFGKAA